MVWFLVIFAVVLLFFSRVLCEKGLHNYIVWEGGANSHNEFTITVANVASATRESIKPAPSQSVVPDECFL